MEFVNFIGPTLTVTPAEGRILYAMNVSTEMAITTLSQFASGDPSWRTTLPWKPRGRLGCMTTSSAALALLLVVAAALLWCPI
jgi:hypothetical protein